MRVTVVGGGAAGFFTAINIAVKNPEAEITILEKSEKLLSKVKVSGGGRCNVTNDRNKPAELVKFYPRGEKKLYSVFKAFSTADMVSWLQEQGVQTTAEDDQRVFPQSNQSQTIIDCFLNLARKHKIKIVTKTSVKSIEQRENQWIVNTPDDQWVADKVVFCSGSSAAALKILTKLGLKATPLVPSLFTFNITDERLQDLQGLSFTDVSVRVVKSMLENRGALLITHWGLSGPAILKLSSWGAMELQKRNYQFDILINFISNSNPDEVRSTLQALRNNPKRLVTNYPPFELPKRFWERICEICQITSNQTSGELSKRQINKLTEELTQGRYSVSGKSTFKEEFVTCGGIELGEVNLKTFECQRYPGLYLAGEVLNIDALTGGFNFQACWSAGWIISEHLKVN